MTVKLLTEQHLELKKEAAQARMSLHLSIYHIVGNHVVHAMAQMKKIKIHLASQSKRRILDVLPTTFLRQWI